MPQPPCAPADRSAAIDGLRAASVLAVVVIHVGGVADAAVRPVLFDLLIGASDFSLGALFLVSGFVTGARGHAASNVRRWIARLAVPYAAWTVIYAVALRLGSESTAPLDGMHLLRMVFAGGAAAHLWFVPALMACHVVGAWCRRTDVLLATVVLTAPLAVLRMLGPVHAPLGYDLVRYTALGWIPLYLLGALLARRSVNLSSRWVRVAAVVLPAVGALGFVSRDRWAPAWAVMVVAGTVLACAMLADVAQGGDALRLSRLGGLAPYGFGIYLAHMVPIYAVKGVWGAEKVSDVVSLTVLLLAVWVSSAAFSWVVARTPARRVLLG